MSALVARAREEEHVLMASMGSPANATQAMLDGSVTEGFRSARSTRVNMMGPVKRQGMAKDTHVIADKALTVTTVKSMSTSAPPIPV